MKAHAWHGDGQELKSHTGATWAWCGRPREAVVRLPDGSSVRRFFIAHGMPTKEIIPPSLGRPLPDACESCGRETKTLFVRDGGAVCLGCRQ